MAARHVLIVCYDFPRLDAAGVIRIYQLAKGLQNYDWQPVILTAQPCSTSRARDIENSDGELSCAKLTVAAPKMRSRAKIGCRTERGSEEQLARGAKGLAAYGRLAVPDGKVGWIYPATRGALKLARAYSFEMCFSTSPRPTAHFVARRLARRLKIPWVADFALPWSDAHWLGGRPQLIGWLDRRLERSVVRSAAHITTAYPDIARSISARFGEALAQRMTVIPTGFNEQLFEARSPKRLAKFTVVYPGNHFCEPGRGGEHFLAAIDQWLTTRPCLKEQMEFVFIGKRDPELLRCRTAMAHPEVVRVEPLVSHRACIQAIRSADACLVNTVGNRVPGKVYECMRAGKPILALAEAGSDLDAAMRSYSKGVVAPSDDKHAILRALGRLRAEERPAGPETDEQGRWLAHYDAAHSARLLSGVFDRVLRSGS
jgi:glycosyl transferase family 4/glycosyl transferase family 1